jgi:hypothetical protein
VAGVGELGLVHALQDRQNMKGKSAVKHSVRINHVISVTYDIEIGRINLCQSSRHIAADWWRTYECVALLTGLIISVAFASNLHQCVEHVRGKVLLTLLQSSTNKKTSLSDTSAVAMLESLQCTDPLLGHSYFKSTI